MKYVFTPLEDFVRDLYFSMSISSPEQISMTEIAENLNIKIHYYDEESEANNIGGIYRIFLNEQLTKQQQWQDFAHELCHILFHTGYQLRMPHYFRTYQEWKASNFAYQFCVPTFMLEKIKLPKRKNEGIEVIAQTFNVEFDFAKTRLERWIRQQEAFIFHQKIAEQKEAYMCRHQ
ncbi:ImmA/IrrE family metallo-endopeptidase [Bacillus aquiflavi]|uniref:ImmA/IrrE family metallo-endopeptidase n=1 Tax=Bacillus aquiflavi TaxID=2672567 RepID=A0A6B3VYE9_9BACI|nr:ImmA/IrrE family metallo-endopeptidase [Bacillus aquiflavi]MBA4536395.1 ImmA/IrrE family metallo-endopeptidase [Bacillus aquiflavi]NEY80763.1 ImmA/IrrE family metallo-endopeptidase [Bacillus aquiflavi]UAC49144.1 ImmA/IrrE family metallo-endopeptidase [Bacillus aquiflavi]